MPEWTVALAVGIIGGGGLAGAIVALLKVRPEAGQIVVQTAQGVVLMQSTMIDDLRGERAADRIEHTRELRDLERRLMEANARIDRMAAEVERCQRLRDEVAKAQTERDAALAEVGVLREQVAHYEAQNHELLGRVDSLETEMATLKGAGDGS